MPPLLPQDSDSILVKSPEPYYTNEDVAILHDIVVHAQDLLPSLPERERLPTNALFHAYHTILPSIGIDADHDNRYARVLFKIGGTRGDGPLYEKFEAVLARMGIEIQFDQGNVSETGHDANTTDAVFKQHSDQSLDSELALAVGDENYSLRGSGSGIQETEFIHKYHKGENLQREGSSSASTANSENPVHRLGAPGTLPSATAHIFKQGLLDTQFRNGEQQEEKDYGLRTWLNESPVKHLQKIQTTLPSLHGSLSLRRAFPQGLEHDPNTERMSNLWLDGFTPADRDRRPVPDIEHLNHPNALSLVPDDISNSGATLMKKLHMVNSIRQILIRWHHEALKLQGHNEKLDALANSHDRRVLLRQALDSWRDGIDQRQLMDETELFFAHLEKRADRARDIFLMAKSLTHWAYNASKEVQRISVARRHILRMRYFSAWHDTTAVHELKARRQVIQKFFLTWQKQYVTVFVNKERAVIHFADNLVRRIFWMWFWAFCERRAPIWRADRLLGKQMIAWARAANGLQREENAAIDYKRRSLCQRTYLTWFRSVSEYAMHTRQAQEYKRSSVCRQTLGVWRHKSALLPRMHILCRKKGLRLKNDSLGQWVLRARQESHARIIDRSKIIREAWITWNDKLRCKALRTKINNRLLLQGLYKWALRERCILARRVLERRMMHSSLQKLAVVLHSSVARESKYDDLARRMSDHRLNSRVIQSWRSRLQNNIHHQQMALEFNRPIVFGNSLARWSGQNQRIQKLRKMATDGDFYFLASKTTRLWKDATEKARKEKRRVAYSQLRRRYKMSLARKLLSRWHLQMNSIAELDRLAANVSHNKLMVLCMEVFDRWRARVEDVADLDSMRTGLLLEKRFNQWKSAGAVRCDLELEAEAFFQEHAITLCWKKWSRVYLQLRAALHLVFEVREKRLKKTGRRVLGHWLRRSSELQHLTRPNHDKINMHSLRPTSSIESVKDPNTDEWVEGVNDRTNSMSILPYLSTPSRRMPRVRSAMRFTSTTPSAPLSTPEERQLRAQYSGGSLASFRSRVGRSVFARAAAPFESEEESRIRTEEEFVE